MPTLPVCAHLGAQPAVVYRDTVEMHAATLRLGDVAVLDALPVRLRARATTIALPWRTVRTGLIDRAAVSSIARAQMPALACLLPAAPGTIRVHVVHTTEPTRYPDTPPAPEATVHPGDALDLTVDVGPVRVERQVTALQPARDGDRLFVSDADGRPLSVRYRRPTP
jgi:hypothetical protein